MIVDKIGFGIGISAIITGLILMASGERMCRSSCWAVNFLKLFFPKEYEFLAGGAVSVLAGIWILIQSITKK